MFSLSGKAAIITGGGSGIGKATAIKFAQQGAQVVIFDLNEAQGTETEAEIKAAGGQAYFVSVNVASQASVTAAFDQAVQLVGGRINALVCSAGIAHIGNLEACAEEDFDRVFAVNVKGVYNCLKAVVPHFKANGGGSIVNLASIASVVGIADRFAYSMSKGAVLTMSLSVARDYISHGIRCNCISPGRVHTPFVDNFIANNYAGREQEMFEALSKSQPIGRMGTPEEMANLILFLTSDEAGFITGSNYHIDGGFISVKM
jgi:NAD(P)-dependent dehydrogenase (short-subunit alcohol dehydrogenase family)